MAMNEGEPQATTLCPCGCGSDGRCFVYGDDVPTGLELVYARAMNARLRADLDGRTL